MCPALTLGKNLRWTKKASPSRLTDATRLIPDLATVGHQTVRSAADSRYLPDAVT